MKTRSYLAKSVSLIILAAMLLGILGVAPASAQEEVVEPPVPVLAIGGGDHQSACIGMAYALPLQVTLIDTAGVAVAGAVVEFAAPPSGASLVPATFTVTTDESGMAGATVTANGSVGAMDVYASYGGQTVMFQLTNTPALVVEISGGEGQSAVFDTAYAQPLQVTVTNLAVPVAGAVVEFVAPKHPGVAGLTLDRFSATTDASGVASAAVTANGYPGAMEVSAEYGGQAVIFHLTNTVQPPAPSVPYAIEPRCEFLDNAFAHDPAANGNKRVCLAQTTPGDCAKYNYCWWRDTTNQNAIAQQTDDQFTGVAYQVYQSSKLRVFFYSSNSGANTVAIVTSNNFFVIGGGGGKMEAMAAKTVIQRLYPSISGKELLGVIYTSVDPQVTWGSEYWRNSFYSNPLAPVYASSEYYNVLDRAGPVAGDKFVRDEYAYGKNLVWGDDSLIGNGSGKVYHPSVAWGSVPTIFINEETTLYSDNTPVTLIPTLPEIAGLSVWLPVQKILIPVDTFGRFLPNIAPLNEPYIPPEHVMAVIDKYRTLQPVTLLTMHTMYVSGSQSISDAWDAQYAALQFIHDQTLMYINQHHHIDDGDSESGSDHPSNWPIDLDGDDVPDDHLAVLDYSLDDIVNLVQLPANLASSPFAQPMVGSVASMVRAIYHEHVGWFDGDPAKLWTLPSQEHARRLIDAMGGASGALQYARKSLTEHTREGAQMALEVAEYLRQVSPSDDANDIYINALKMLGFTTKSALERNWYLQEAYRAEMGH